VGNLVVSNLDGFMPGTVGVGNRAAIIANEPLLEARIGANQQKLLTTYGKANASYEIDYSTNLVPAPNWVAAWTNTIPSSLFQTAPVSGTISNELILFLRAREK